MSRSIHRIPAALLAVLVVSVSSCATLGQIRALEHVDFSIAGVSQVRLAGVDLSSVRGFGDLSLADGAILANAVRQGELPLAMEIRVLAQNPADNLVDARIVNMDWTLLLEDRETVSGEFVGETVLPRGEATVLPVTVSLNLVDFFEGSSRDLFELALSFTGMGGGPRNVTLLALPVVETVLGPITYERPLRIVSVDVGG